MARQLDEFPEHLHYRPQNTSRFPWDEWLDGSVWELLAGEDYTVKTRSFRSNAQSVARKRQGRLRSALLPEGKGLVIQYIPEAPAAGEASSSTSPADRELNRAIRTWARANGWPNMADFGRLPAEVVQAYERARAHPYGNA